jgi:hypothetical protein
MIKGSYNKGSTSKEPQPYLEQIYKCWTLILKFELDDNIETFQYILHVSITGYPNTKSQENSP